MSPENGRTGALKNALQNASGVVDLLLPPACRLCLEPVAHDQEFCQSCSLGLTLSEPKMMTACTRCGRPGALAASATPIEHRLCNQSQAEAGCPSCEKEQFIFDQVIATWTYEGLVCDAIVAAKHASRAALANCLGSRLGDKVRARFQADPGDDVDMPDRVTFVPSSIRRRMTRGGRNGVATIAQAVAESLRPLGRKTHVSELLRTTRAIKKQAWLTDKERLENVSGAFAAKKGYAWTKSTQVNNLHVLVVDDVLTTGATANEVTRVLRNAGARRVTLAVVARAVWS